MAYTVTITGSGDTGGNFVAINNTVYTSAATVSVSEGTYVLCQSFGDITLNGNVMESGEMGAAAQFILTVINDVQIVLSKGNFGSISYTCAITMSEQPADPTAPKDGHNVLIDGTACQIESGTVMIGGTVYEIEKGEVLIGGTVYEIPFKAATVKLILSTDINTTNERVTVDSQSYTTAGEYEIEQGSTIAFAVKASNSRYTSTIKLNGTTVVSMSSTSWKSYEVVADTDVTVSSNTVGQGTVSNRTGALIITTS